MGLCCLNAGRGIRRVHINIRPTRPDFHGCRPGGFLSRACIARRHCAVELVTYNPLTHQETWGIDASFKGLRVHSTYAGLEIGGGYVSRKRGHSSRYASHTQCPSRRLRSDFVAVRGRRFDFPPTSLYCSAIPFPFPHLSLILQSLRVRLWILGISPKFT